MMIIYLGHTICSSADLSVKRIERHAHAQMLPIPRERSGCGEAVPSTLPTCHSKFITERKAERWRGKGKERKKDGGKGKKGSKMGGNGMKEMGKRGKKDEGKWKERKKDGEKVKRKEEKGKKGPKTEAKRVKFIFFTNFRPR